jgi:hypothetical protein
MYMMVINDEGFLNGTVRWVNISTTLSLPSFFDQSHVPLEHIQQAERENGSHPGVP